MTRAGAGKDGCLPPVIRKSRITGPHTRNPPEIPDSCLPAGLREFARVCTGPKRLTEDPVLWSTIHHQTSHPCPQSGQGRFVWQARPSRFRARRGMRSLRAEAARRRRRANFPDICLKWHQPRFTLQTKRSSAISPSLSFLALFTRVLTGYASRSPLAVCTSSSACAVPLEGFSQSA